MIFDTLKSINLKTQNHFPKLEMIKNKILAFLYITETCDLVSADTYDSIVKLSIP